MPLEEPSPVALWSGSRRLRKRHDTGARWLGARASRAGPHLLLLAGRPLLMACGFHQGLVVSRGCLHPETGDGSWPCSSLFGTPRQQLAPLASVVYKSAVWWVPVDSATVVGGEIARP